MAITTFSGPIRTGEDVGSEVLSTTAFVHVTKVVRLSQAEPRKIITLPANSCIFELKSVLVSAITGTDPASALSVNFGTSSQPTYFGTVAVSALQQLRGVAVSGSGFLPSLFSNGGTMVLTVSAISTTVFTGGAAQAFVTYIQEA
jgi:hypothetical protein